MKKRNLIDDMNLKMTKKDKILGKTGIKVKVDFFRLSGKWYMTEEIEWYDLYSSPTMNLRDSIRKSRSTKLEDFYVVCIDSLVGFPLHIKI